MWEIREMGTLELPELCPCRAGAFAFCTCGRLIEPEYRIVDTTAEIREDAKLITAALDGQREEA